MKKHHGNILLIFLISFFFSTELFAQDYRWKSYTNKNSAFVNEAIYLKYKCEFVDRGELYVIEFAPKSTEKFEIISLSQSQKIQDNKRIQIYEYVVFPKESGKLKLDFDVTMKKTNEDSIENTVLGRDNAQFEEYTTHTIKQDRLFIDIKKAPTPLIGDFKIKIKKDKESVKAYEPYHLSISISGVGNLNLLEEFKFLNLDAELFESKPKKEYVLTKDGYEGTFSQKFAFVSDKNFNIKEFSLRYFNIKEEQVHSLDFKGIDVEVTKAYTPVELLDKIDEESFKFNIEYLYYLLTFIAGFLVAKIKFKSKKTISAQEEKFNSKVKNTKTLDELHMLLILQNKKIYKNIILDIENKKIDSLAAAKKLLKV